jgi:SulP family sulfate permease
LIPFAAALAVLGFLSSMTIIKASESKTGILESSPNKELRALGLANIVGAFFQSYVASASFSRSSILMGIGSKSRWTVLFSAALVGLSLFVLTPLFEHIPMAVLSAIVLFSLIQLLSFTYPIKLWKQARAEFLVFLCTFALTLFVGIVQGLVLGILVSLFVWISRSVKPHYAVLGKIKNTHYYKNINRFSQDIEQDERLLLFRFDAPIFFANKDYFNQMLMDEIDERGEKLQEVVLISRGISYLDSSSIELLHHILNRLSQRDLGFSVAGAIGPMRDAMRRSGLMERIGAHRFFSKTADAVSYLNGDIDTTEHSENIATQTNKLKV